MELLHLWVNEELGGGERGSVGPGGVGDVHSCRQNIALSELKVRATNPFQVWNFFAFEVFLVGETQSDQVTVASGAFAVPGHPSTEARYAAAIHTEVSLRAVS